MSNAFWKSRRMASVCTLLSILCARLSMIWISCVSVERFFFQIRAVRHGGCYVCLGVA